MLKRFIKAIDKIEDICLVIMFAGMVAVIFMQVIMRYVFNNSLFWSEELGKFLFVWISWLGISIGHRRQEHIKITMLVDKLPVRWNKAFEAVVEICLIIICGITMYYGIMMMQVQVGIPYAGIKISTAWGYLAVVLGCGLMIVRAVIFLIEAVQCLIHEKTGMEGGNA